MASAGLVINFAVWPENARAAVVDVELANDDAALSRVWVCPDSDDPVRNAAYEEVPPLASYISRRCHKSAWQFLLYGCVVGIDSFRNRIVRRISPRRERSVQRSVDETRTHRGHVDRVPSAVHHRIDQIAFD